jgi:hypothetical protein
MITPLCHAAPSRAWCLIGDCNLTLHSVETSAPSGLPSPNRIPYLTFLQQTDGQDLWLTQLEAIYNIKKRTLCALSLHVLPWCLSLYP